MLDRSVSISSGRSRNDNSVDNGARKNSSAGSSLSVASKAANGIGHRRAPTNGSNLFRRRHIDVIVRNILIALRKPKPSEIHLVYHLISQLNAILQLQRRYMTVSESTFLDEIVTVPTLLKIIDTITKEDFVGWQIASHTDHGLLCRELQLRTIVCGLRLLRLHGLKTLDGDLLDNLTKKLPSAADPNRRKDHDTAGEVDIYNWNIDFLLVYIRNFLSSLPESRTANAAIVSKIITSASGLADEQTEVIPLKILSKSRELLNQPDISDSTQTNWHKIYIDLDDLSWSLVEWHKRAKVSQDVAPDAQEHNLHLIQEIEELVVEQLELVMDRQLSLLEQAESEDTEAPEGKDPETVKKCSDNAQHLAYSSLDLLQQLVVGALGDGSLKRAREISMHVVKSTTKSSLRCKAFDILSILMQKGVLSLIQLDAELKGWDVDSSFYLMVLEQRDRSQSAMLTKRRLDEQSEVQTDQSIFKLPDKELDNPYQEPESESASQVATLSFRSRPNVSVPLLADLDEWRTFLSEIELELECEGRKDGKPSDDLGIMTCGCVMSEKFARLELQRSICPRCHRVTEWKHPAQKLRRIAKLVAAKRMEMGAVLNTNHRFSVVISSPGGPDEFEDGISSEIGGSTAPSEIEEAMAVGAGAGGFPKEVPWENPSIKYTPSTLEKLLRDAPPQIVPRNAGNDSDGSRSTSRNASIIDTASEENLAVPGLSSSLPINRQITHRTGLSSILPTTKPMFGMQRRQSGSDRHSERSGPASTNGGRAFTEPGPRSPDRTQGSGIYGSYQRPGTGANLSTSPIGAPLSHSPSVSSRYRVPSLPGGTSGVKPLMGSLRMHSPSTAHPEEDEAGPSDYHGPRIGRNDRIANWIDRNQEVPQENTVVRPPLNQQEEQRHNKFSKNFPFYKAEYVHHIPTGGRLRFPDIVATAISPSCTKFVLLERKKFKVFSILSSEKTPELLCAGKCTGEYGPHANQYGLISAEDRVMAKPKRFEYLFAACSENLLAIAGTSGTLKVHDLRQDGKTVYTYISESSDIKCMAMSGDGSTIALGVVNMEHGKNQTMIVLHHLDTALETGNGSVGLTKIIVPYTDTTGTLSFSDDGVYLACSTLREPRFLVYDLAAQPPKLVMKSSRKLDISHDAEGITSVKFFPGNRLMCVTSVATNAMPIVVDNCIGLLDSSGRQEPIRLVTRLNTVGDKVHGCCTSPTGESLAALDRSGNVLILYFPLGLVNDEGRRPRCLKVAKVQGAIKMTEAASMSFSPDGYRLIIVDRKGDITIIDFAELDDGKLSKSTAWE
ncbi:SPS-sensor component ptr3, variant 2 [Orbilia blumenaviensis]|uniref:SPS-sensor component ptr3, variant 2 n=1 Tax=Orbilia blumenaviensis TaxID=1796055 RepID=A0AAV9UWA9_9PEZI